MITTLMLIHGLIYALIGIVAGLMAGLFGIGGGLIVVPALVFVFQSTHFIPNAIMMYMAVGTSLAAMIITTHAAVKAHAKFGIILWPVFHKLWPGLIIGTVTGAIVAAWIPTFWLKVFFALFLIFVALKMLLAKDSIRGVTFPAAWINFLVNIAIGINSGLLGIGGGMLIVPYLTHCGIETRKIAAITNLCALLIAIVGTIAFLCSGYQQTRSIAYSTGYVYWPAVFFIGIFSSLMAPLGAKLSYQLPVQHLKYGFILLLLLTAIKMLF